MMKNELREMVLPHNLSKGAYQRHFKKLINTANELGGIIYEVAEAAGLFSAERYMQLQFEENEDEEFTTMSPAAEDMTVVTEVYVDFGNGEPMDRIFLYSKDVFRDVQLLQEGIVRDRKLIIPYEKLAGLHEKGYKCFYGNAPDGRNGKNFARYTHCFGDDRRLVRYEMWDWCTYVGNGFNRALMVQTVFENMLVMPDLYAVRESIKTFYAENLIRENYEATFSIERINMRDDGLVAALKAGKVDIMGSGNVSFYRKLPNCYQKLIYQIAYIQTYYPDIYSIVWSEDFEADDEKTDIDIFSTEKTAILGICLDSQESDAVCMLEDGSIKRIPNWEYSHDVPLCKKYTFKGYGTFLNAGMAGSRMAIIMKDIIKSTEITFDVQVKKVCITHNGVLPKYEDIDWFMNRRRKRAEANGIENSSAELIAYEQIADRKPDGAAVIHWATELAGISDYVLTDSLTGSMKVFENKYPDAFQKNKPVLMFLFSEKQMGFSLLEKCADGSFEVTKQVTSRHPEEHLGSAEEWVEEADYSSLIELLEWDLEEFMLEAGLGALGIDRENGSQYDMEALQKLRDNAKKVKKQLRRNDVVSVSFDNGYLTLGEDYPIERFEKCFSEILKTITRCFEALLEDAQIRTTDISGLLMLGEETEYPFVRKHVEQLTGLPARYINASECIEARGAILCGMQVCDGN